MKNLLTMQNLMSTHYDNGDHILEFEADGRKIFVTIRGLGPVDDEFYWDDEDNLARALAEVKEDDIEEQLIEKHIDGYELMTVDKIIENSTLSEKEKKHVRRLIDESMLQVRKEDIPLFEHWLANDQLDGYHPMFYGGYTPERFQAEQIDQLGYEADLENRQWYTVIPEGIIEYADEPGWWK